MSQLAFHPLANIFPLVDGREFDELVEDIAAHGVREAVWLYEGAILDGRNRYRASAIAGVDCPMREYLGDDPAAFVVSLNLRRRHLSESQRSLVSAHLANMRQGARTDIEHSASLPEVSQAEAAALLNVSERSLRTAKTVLEQGAPELVAAVEAGAVSVSAAADVATLPKEEQAEVVARGEKEILEKAKAIRAEKVEKKRAEKIAATEVIAANNRELPVGERKYSVIYADPPWSFEVWSGAGKDRAAENHYPTMTQADIEALPVADMAADDCVLFLWAVMPQLQEALDVISAWGFEYKTCAFVWVKTTQDGERPATGMGYWTRANAEICLLATRGTPVRLNADVHQIVQTPRQEHSRKPEEIAARIERLVPGPYLEMFSRAPRDGWDAWGNQSEAA